MSDIEEFEFDEPQDFDEQPQEQPQEQVQQDKSKNRKEQKQIAKERKQQRPHAPLIQGLKSIWEELRMKRLTKQERRALMDKMMESVRGKAQDIIFKHDASRIIQCCLKYGTPEQRDEIAKELVGQFVRLSQSQYGRFIVSRVLQYCSSTYRDLVIKEFYGQVRKLVRHKEASIILDEAYSQFCNAQQRMHLMEEFYGPEFAIFKKTGNTKSLDQILKDHPEKKPYVLKHMRSVLDSVLEKGTFNLGRTHILHRAIYDYMTYCDHKEFKDLIELLKDHLVHILHTAEGAKIVQLCLLHATPKDRKHIIKTFKGLVQTIAREQYGYVVLISCFETIDDTVLLSKSLIAELFKDGESTVSQLMRDRFASKVYFYLLSGRSSKHQTPQVLQDLKRMDQVRQNTTKKDDETRKQQLLEASGPLFSSMIVEYLQELLRDKIGTDLIVLACNTIDPQPILDKITEFMTAVPVPEEFNAVKKLRQESIAKKQEEEGLDMQSSLFVNRSATFCLKNLMRKKDQDLPWKSQFCQQLWSAVESTSVEWLEYCAKEEQSSGTTYLFIAMFENGSDALKQQMKDKLGSKIKTVEATEKKRKQDQVSPFALLTGYLSK
ncbi:armadillo-type protein [Gorgonomyces haynaldii]|nr:armadillo-type protein [Gorgonomyces haynaldii]